MTEGMMSTDKIDILIVDDMSEKILVLESVLEAIYQGDAFLTRLEGEWCTSFRM